MILCFFVISIFVVKERVVNSTCISMLSFGICSSFFGVFIRAFLERVRQSSNFCNASPFLFCSFESINLSTYLSIYQPIYQCINLSIYQSINLQAIYLPICLYEVICPSFLKAVLSAETVSFIKTVYREIQIQTKALYELYWVV